MADGKDISQQLRRIGKMKIDFKDYGAVAAVTITSTIFEFRKHNRVVDATLLCTPASSANGAAASS
jgi:hypothetical protein